MGRPIYVKISASTVNGGIMTMETSGGGQSSGNYWINWSIDDGFTGGNLAWAALEPWIGSTNWHNVADEKGYENSFTGFMTYLTNERPNNLDDVLGTWDMKGDFIETYWMQLTGGTGYPFATTSCVTI